MSPENTAQINGEDKSIQERLEELTQKAQQLLKDAQDHNKEMRDWERQTPMEVMK
jgi:prefoldin subunit 5